MKSEKRYHENEDFFYDEAFANFLEYLEETRESKGYKKPWRLVINGDFLDFLQVTTAPDPNNPQEIDAFKAFIESATGEKYEDKDLAISEKEYKLGLGFDAPKSVWKLQRIIDGHPRFFGALAEFLNAGNELLVIKGNHDAEFSFVEVRDYFRKSISEFAAKIPDSGLMKKPKEGGVASDRIYFSRWFYYEEGLFYAEHGGQYDDSNRYVFFLDPTMVLKGKKLLTLRFPFGSFFVRYFFNRIEERVPFADNIRPRLKAFSWICMKKTLYAVLECGTIFSFFINFVRKKILSHFDLLVFLEWLRSKRNMLVRCLYYFFFLPLIKIQIRPNPEQYNKYKLRNFWFMFEIERTDGVIPEKNVDTAKTELSILEILKIYNRSFKEGAIPEEKEKELMKQLQTLMPTETGESRTPDPRVTLNIINRVVSETSSAAKRKPVFRTCVFENWRLVAGLLSKALIILAFALWIFSNFDMGILALIIGLTSLGLYLSQGLGEEILIRYYDIEPEKYLNKAAAGVARILKVPYVIFGHTHVAYVKPIASDEKDKPKNVSQWEVNTGSWTPVFDEEMLLRRTGDEFPFIQLTTENGDEPELQLLHWNDELGEPQTIRFTGRY